MRDKFRHAVERCELAKWVGALRYRELDEAVEIIIEQCQAGTINIVQEFEILNVSSFKRRQHLNWSRVFQDVIPHISITPSVIFNISTRILNASSAANDYYIRTGFSRWLESNPKHIDDIFSLIVEKKEDSELMYACLLAWRQHDELAALDGLLSVIGSRYVAIRRAAMHALAIFDLSMCERATDAFIALQGIAADSPPEEAAGAVFSITSQLERSTAPIPTLVNALERSCINPSREVRRELIGSWAARPNAYSDQARDAVFELMSSVASQDSATLEYVEVALGKLDLDSDREIVMSILSQLLIYESGTHSLRDLDSITNALLKSSDEVRGWYVINWLLTGKSFLCMAVFELFPPMNRSVINFTLKDFELSEGEVSYLARKVFGYLLESNEVAVSLLCACLIKLDGDAQINLAKDIANYWLLNYPQDIELFEALEGAHTELKKSVKIVKKINTQYLDGLNEFDENLALRPSLNERRTQYEIENQNLKRMHKEVEKTSVLGSIMPTKSVLYGNSIISYIQRGGSEPPERQEITMQPHSMVRHEAMMKVFCPAWLNYLRFTYRMEKRPT